MCTQLRRNEKRLNDWQFWLMVWGFLSMFCSAGFLVAVGVWKAYSYIMSF